MGKTSFSAVFRVDGSIKIGGGHVMRCLTLADALRSVGWSCGFAVRDDTETVVPPFRASGHERLVLNCEESEESSALRTRWPEGIDLLIVDHFGRDVSFERLCRPWARQIMAIDGIHRCHDCDILLDPNLDRRPEDYAPLVSTRCQLLLGPRYALLRREFIGHRAAALSRRQDQSEVRRILVSMGATDNHNIAAVALQGIVEAGSTASVDLVIGPKTPHILALEELVEQLPINVTLRKWVPNMARLIAQADVAIGTAGSAAWEYCCLGLPSILLVAADNQYCTADSLTRHHAARALGDWVSVRPADIADALRQLELDNGLRKSMSEAGAQICDGQGVSRLSTHLTAETRALGGAGLAFTH